MLIWHFSEKIWPCIEASVNHLVNERKNVTSKLVQSGLNFSIVLGSACYVEGTIETILRAALGMRRKEFIEVPIDDLALRRAVNSFFNRVEEEFGENIGRATGAAGYDQMFELLTGYPLSKLDKVKTRWEGITVLFHFRNVLGHGREVAARQYRGGAAPGGMQEDFTGSYKKVEDYLHKKKLLSKKFVEAHDELLYLDNPIADHFWNLAHALPDAIVKSLAEADGKASAIALKAAATAAQKHAK
jgi:hypothetical protein